jgi:regulator of protease activity HflC (stomatin/prohibitin superfamily)
MNIRTQEYTMSIAKGEGKKFAADAIAALTREGLNVDLDITVLYHLQEEKASDVYRDVGLSYDEVIIRPQIRSVIREVIANYDAKDIYSAKRQEATQNILDQLKERLVTRGIETEEVLLRNVQLPEDLAQSIQEKLQSEQEAQRYDFVLEKEKKEAERKRLEAAGQRDAQQIINESLTNRYLQFLYIESLKDREGTIYVPTNPNNGVPLFRGL